tara:strand:+ start:265 stop:924 length:660 start_codon:yes stop_codon:yes gene_type:complete
LSKVQVDTIDTRSGTATMTVGSTNTTTVSIPKAITLGANTKTITVPSGATLDVASGATLDATGATVTGISSGDMTPAFQATMSADVDATNNVWTKVPANTETYDTDGKYDNSSNYRFTPGEAGKYFIYGMVQADQKLSSFKWEASQIAIYKNGSEYLVQSFIDLRQGGGDGGSVNISVVVDMDSDDYVELYAKPRSLNDEQCRFGDGSTLFGGYKLIGV